MWHGQLKKKEVQHHAYTFDVSVIETESRTFMLHTHTYVTLSRISSHFQFLFIPLWFLLSLFNPAIH